MKETKIHQIKAPQLKLMIDKNSIMQKNEKSVKKVNNFTEYLAEVQSKQKDHQECNILDDDPIEDDPIEEIDEFDETEIILEKAKPKNRNDAKSKKKDRKKKEIKENEKGNEADKEPKKNIKVIKEKKEPKTKSKSKKVLTVSDKNQKKIFEFGNLTNLPQEDEDDFYNTVQDIYLFFNKKTSIPKILKAIHQSAGNVYEAVHRISVGAYDYDENEPDYSFSSIKGSPEDLIQYFI